MSTVDSIANSKMEESLCVRVNIYGDEYPIKGKADEEYIHELASYVDKKMREIVDRVPPRDKLKVAILAAVNIASELFEMRGTQGSDSSRQLEQIRLKTEELNQKLDSMVKA